MTTQRKRKRAAIRLLRGRRWDSKCKDLLWDRTASVGRVFGSPDLERLMEEDFRVGTGVFDNAPMELKPA